MNNSWLLFLLVLPFVMFSQNRTILKGKVVAEEVGVHGIYVINATAGVETKTNQGNFSVEAQSGDRLVFYSPKITTREFVLNEDSFKQSSFVVTVSLQAYQLNEVVIERYGDINEETLGLVPKGQKQYTPAEKKLKTAGEMKPIFYLGVLGGAMPLDPIINAITGKTKMLKEALKTERKEKLMEVTGNLFKSEKEIAGEFNIPEEYVKGFLFHIVEDTTFANAVKSKNQTQAKFLMAQLAEKYLKLIKENNE